MFLLRKSDLIKGSQSVHAGNKAFTDLNQTIILCLCISFTGKHADKNACDLKAACAK